MIPVVFILLSGFAIAFGGEPVVNCVAPRSPDHGQAFLYQDGRVVKIVCEPGYTLLGKEIVRCVDGLWEEQLPICIPTPESNEEPSMMSTPAPPVPPQVPSRPLFNWGDEEEKVEEAVVDEKNDTTDDDMMSDEARLRMVLYPRRRGRIVTSRVRTARVRSASEIEDEEKKRSDDTTTTTVRLHSPPSVVYVRRTVTPGKSSSQEKTLTEQYRTAAVHFTVDDSDDNKDHVQMVALPRAAVSQNDKGDEALRHMYWVAAQNYAHYPRAASLVEYRSGNPVVMTLSESQIAWINSLHPELRDQYLRDLYVLRAEEAVEGQRAQAFLRRYGDAYNYYHHAPLYYRQALLTEDLTNIYDYSCNQAGSPFVTAPKLPNAHIARYDRRQNSNSPNNHYLTAVYRCNPGFVMLDTRFTELHCSRRSWIGTEPICVPRA